MHLSDWVRISLKASPLLSTGGILPVHRASRKESGEGIPNARIDGFWRWLATAFLTLIRKWVYTLYDTPTPDMEL